MFSKACQYGIKSVIFIAKQSKSSTKVSLKTVAAAIESPVAYTSKILQELKKNNIIISEKGPTGGFSMNSSQLNTINLSNIVIAIDGDSIFKGCGLGLRLCDATKPCPVHHKFEGIRNGIKDMLENTLVHSLTNELFNGITFLKN